MSFLFRTFEPLWGVLRVATEKLANAHMQVVQKFQELIKELKDYGDKQKEKHKQVRRLFVTVNTFLESKFNPMACLKLVLNFNCVLGSIHFLEGGGGGPEESRGGSFAFCLP